MAIVSIFGGPFCNSSEVARQTAEILDYRLIEEDLFEEASRRFGVAVGDLKRAVHGPPSIYYKFTREKELHIAYLQRVLAEALREDCLVYEGFLGHLIPSEITHVLKVCIIANLDYRVEMAIKAEGLNEKAARRTIRKEDESRLQWTQYLHNREPYDAELYDMVIPTHDRTLARACGSICENIHKEKLKTVPASLRAVADFNLASEVNVAVLHKGHNVKVSCRDGKVLITIDKFVLRLEHLETELKGIAREVDGVREVETQVGSSFRGKTSYFPLDLEMPQKVLLVDDEKDFVEALSERLVTRNIGSAVAYDGEQTLALLESEKPEVIVLDLRMPGIDGIEVLRRVKRDHADIEVIILTGHGSQQEKALAEQLGAFAYLEKPTDIDQLTKTMKAAYQHSRSRKAQREQPPALR